jgi:hypothetical protein
LAAQRNTIFGLIIYIRIRDHSGCRLQYRVNFTAAGLSVWDCCSLTGFFLLLR